MIIKTHANKGPRLIDTILFSSLVLFSLNSAYAAISDTDWDNDGISDDVEEQLGTSPYLADTDGDGISDKDEIGDITNPRDSDNDGLIDAKDIDDDGDGIPTVYEGNGDADKDGIPNYLDQDSDGDGLADRFEVPLTGKDSDNDKIDDFFDSDSGSGADENGDGVADKVVLIDSDKDGQPDLLDKDSSMPHVDQRKKATPVEVAEEPKQEQEKSETMAEEEQEQEAAQAEPQPVVLSVPSLPQLEVKREHSYTETEPQQATINASYGGTGYFYCHNSGKIVPGIKGFMLTPPSAVKIDRDAKDGHYQWSTDTPGTYAMQFQVPQGMSIARGLAKGRRIIKQGDADPVILGGDENPAKRGYIMQSPTGNNNWHTSFEIKDGAPTFRNNNIPLTGGVCEQP